jgi:hypothetical protein
MLQLFRPLRISRGASLAAHVRRASGPFSMPRSSQHAAMNASLRCPPAKRGSAFGSRRTQRARFYRIKRRPCGCFWLPEDSDGDVGKSADGGPFAPR